MNLRHFNLLKAGRRYIVRQTTCQCVESSRALLSLIIAALFISFGAPAVRFNKVVVL